MKRAVLTGATGFVGANLARRLLREGHEVHLLVRPGYSGWRIDEIRAAVTLHEVDFCDRPTLESVLAVIRPDWVFHLAAHGAYSWQNDVEQIVQTNIVGTINLVEASLKIGFESFVNTGSSSEYGYKDHAPVEDEFIDPNSHYAIGKAAATMYCRYTALKHRVRLTTLRLYSVYGPYEEPARLIPALVLKGLQGQLPPLVDPTIARDYVYAEDVNDAYMAAATTESDEFGAVYNVGTGVQTRLDEVVAIARHELNLAVEPVWGSMPARQWDTSIWVADNTRIRQQLGWVPRHSFADGFHKTVEWFRNRPPIYPAL
jgi:nucleoside-diphosphate-sugar epimerase